MMKIRRIFFLGLCLPLLTSAAEPTPIVPAASVIVPAITNFSELTKALKVKSFKGRKFTRKLKVAILDNGFNGWEAAKGKTIPENVQYHPGPTTRADDRPESSFHGVMMAQILSGLIKESGAQADYELHLFNAYGVTKFSDAVDVVVRERFDIVLYAQLWEFGGNGDGKGFINAIVDKALKAGVTWINASGKFGRLTKLAPVAGKADGDKEYVTFKGEKDPAYVGFSCKAEGTERCSFKLVLTWNDFKDNLESGTDKDLDVSVLDTQGREVAVSDRNQALVADEKKDPKASAVPRELIESCPAMIPRGTTSTCEGPDDLLPGEYRIRVRIKSKNFSADKDQLRLTLTGQNVEMTKPSLGETVLPPADKPGVLVVGAADDLNSSSSKKLALPHVNLLSLIKMGNDGIAFGASTAAAMAAAVAVLEAGTGTPNTLDPLVAKLKKLNVKPIDPKAVPAAGKESNPENGQAGSLEAQQRVRRKQPEPQRPAPEEDYANVYRRDPYRGEPTPQDARPARNANRRCLRRARLASDYPALNWLLEEGGGQAVVIRDLPAILINYTSACYQGVCPQPGEQLVLTPSGPDVVPMSQLGRLPPGYYPIVMRDLRVCP